MAEEVRRLDDDGGGVVVDVIEDVALPFRRGRLADQTGRVVEIGADDVAIMRMEAAREDDLVLAGQPPRHQHGLGGGGRAVIHRGVGDLHAGQVRDLGLELEQHLQRALRHFRLVGRVGGQPFGALDQVIDGRRDVVAIGAGADEERPVARGVVLARRAPACAPRRGTRANATADRPARSSSALVGTALNSASAVAAPMTASISARSASEWGRYLMRISSVALMLGLSRRSGRMAWRRRRASIRPSSSPGSSIG